MPGQSRTRWGWHQLDRAWARRLVVEAEVRPGDLVVDAGAGTGALTRPLVAAGASVIAVELNRARARRLREIFGDAEHPRDGHLVCRGDPFEQRKECIVGKLVRLPTGLRHGYDCLLPPRPAVPGEPSGSSGGRLPLLG